MIPMIRKLLLIFLSILFKNYIELIKQFIYSIKYLSRKKLLCSIFSFIKYQINQQMGNYLNEAK